VVTYGQLHAAAKGESDGFLTRAARSAALRDWPKTTRMPTLSISVIPTAGDIHRERSYGWPISLISVADTTGYADFRTKSGEKAPGPPWASFWNWDRIEISSGTLASGTTYRRITWNLFGTCFFTLLVLGAAWIGRRLLAPLLRRERDSARALAKARRIGLCAAAAFLLLAALCTVAVSRYDQEWTPLSAPAWKDVIDLDFRQDGFLRVEPGPISDAVIAGRAIERMPSRTSDDAIVMFVYAAPYSYPSFDDTRFGPHVYPWLSLRFERETWPGPSAGLNAWATWFTCRVGSGAVSVMLNHTSLAPAILLLILAHSLATRITRFALLRSAVSRRKKDLCQRCAYPLPKARSTQPAPG
jgi:hypothetical protein